MMSVIVLTILAVSIHRINSEEVLIIGAGASGIAAATKLLEFNITNIKLLEAEDRIGGRINSVFFGDAYIDIGAEAVHGEKGNIAYELAKDVLKHNDTVFDKSIVYTSDGKKVGSELSEEILYYLEHYDHNNVTCESSIGDEFLTRYSADILHKYWNDTKKLEIATAFIEVLQGLVLSEIGSLSWYDATACQNYEVSEGDQGMLWSGRGYKTILEILMRNYKNKGNIQSIDNKISLSKTVTKVVWNASDGVIVQCQDGSNYSAKYVLFTPSLGVLKADYKTLFEPEYPIQKVKALSGLGIYGVMKISFHFPNKWWNDAKDFLFIHSKRGKSDLAKVFKDEPILDGTPWVCYFNDLIVVPNNPNVLIGWYTGPLLPKVEELSKEQIKTGTMYIIKKFLGNDYNITEPLDIISSRWHNNPHFRGSYSYEKVKSKYMKIDPHLVIQEPLLAQNGTPRVLFAGEATHPSKYSTVHGAIESGHREAGRLIKLIKKQ